MGAMQRTKGAVFEREIAKVFSRILGREVKRHIGQARDGGLDIDATPFAVECKRRKALACVQQWFQQVGRAVTLDAPIPVVVLRCDHDDEIVMLRLEDFERIGKIFIEAVRENSGDETLIAELRKIATEERVFGFEARD